jgi:D-alanine-D-alanine ligase
VPAESPVVAALERLGHTVTPLACTLDLAAIRRDVERAEPDIAFNRVESLGGSDSMIAAVTLLLDWMDIPYTGCPTGAFVSTASKVAVKERLVKAGLPTPEWITSDFGPGNSNFVFAEGFFNPQSAIRRPKFILKSVYEHASYEMDDASILGASGDSGDIARIVSRRSEESGRVFFAERFIEGREFNLSLLGAEPQILPPAEIDFSAFPPDKPRIVGYSAKWHRSSFEFHNTPRRFDFPPEDLPLLQRLCALAVECWRLFELRGYARVDFRCDDAGQPWILEINANPCLSPAAGFAAALQRAGIGYDGGIQRILAAAKVSGGAKLNRKRSVERAGDCTPIST